MTFRRTGMLMSVMVTGVLLGVAPFVARAEPGPGTAEPSLPQFEPHASNWSPDYSLFPYNLWQSRVTPEQVVAEREACQWFNARYSALLDEVHRFQSLLGGHDDEWSAPGVRGAAATLSANLDQSAAFLQPRAHALFITNYPDRSRYSPLFHGDSVYRLWFQLTQISDKIDRELPSGQINANVATAGVYGTAIRDARVCDGA